VPVISCSSMKVNYSKKKTHKKPRVMVYILSSCQGSKFLPQISTEDSRQKEASAVVDTTAVPSDSISSLRHWT
jgi:hypothetical protein